MRYGVFVGLMWQRPVPERRRSVPLDRDLIVAAAIGLAVAAHADLLRRPANSSSRTILRCM
jgi:hypothetical protein